MFSEKKSLFSLRLNKAYGLCSVLLGFAILGLSNTPQVSADELSNEKIEVIGEIPISTNESTETNLAGSGDQISITPPPSAINEVNTAPIDTLRDEEIVTDNKLDEEMMLAVQANSNPTTEVSVGTLDELKVALAANQNIQLTADIEVTENLKLSGYNGNISSDNSGSKTLSLGANVFEMFTVDNKSNLTFNNVNLDGKETGRLIRAFDSTITLNQGSLKNGRGWNERLSAQAVLAGDGGAIHINKGSLTLDGTLIENNQSVQPTEVNQETGKVQHKEGTDGHGGAIYAFESTVSMVGVTARGNSSGADSGGGVMYATDNSRVIVSDSTFSENKTAGYAPANQGGVFNLRKGTILRSESNVYNVAKSFNTGGAIYLHSSETHSSNDKFMINNLGDQYGISGGAISSEDSRLTIDKAHFEATGNSKLTYAGGFIIVVGKGEFNLLNSEMTGSGTWWNGPRIATYGGAIAFESAPQTDNYPFTNVKALIENTTIQNVGSDSTGTIAVGTQIGFKENAVQLTLKNSHLRNNRTNLAWSPSAVGGALYVGPGNTVVIDGGTISNSFATRGGAIYNEGTLTITGGATLSNNTTYQIGGAVFNDGVLTIDKATLTNNYNAENRPAHAKPIEKIGGNIYAKKDVTITPNAVFDANDVRVLDKESAILLTGPLTQTINVSISEKSLANYETPQRHIGYVVAKGKDGYIPTISDVNLLHYVTNSSSTDNTYNQLVAEKDDFYSIGKWDFVLNPESKEIVVGQRAKMIYDTNGGMFNDNSTSKEWIQDVYKSGLAPNAIQTDPTREGYTFVGWFSEKDKDAVKELTKTSTVPAKFNDVFASENPQTTILVPSVLKAYAGW